MKYIINCIAWCITFVCMTYPLYAENYVILKGGIKVNGSAISMAKDGSVTLTTASGKVTYSPDRYTEVHADRPAELDGAIRLQAGGKYEEAIAAFTKIARDYQGLEWDDTANLQIAATLAAKKDYTAALARYETLFAKKPELKKQSDALWIYHQALLETKQYDKLQTLLQQAIRDGSHADAMRAQMMRGDIAARQDDLEKALLDYLRTVYFTQSRKDAPLPDLVPQAMFKAAQILEKIKDARAREWYRRVIQEYPNSREAGLAKSKF